MHSTYKQASVVLTSVFECDLFPEPYPRGGLEAVLDVHQSEILGTESGHFRVAFNGAEDAFSTLSAYKIYPGQRSDFRVRMLQVTASRDGFCPAAKCYTRS